MINISTGTNHQAEAMITFLELGWKVELHGEVYDVYDQYQEPVELFLNKQQFIALAKRLDNLKAFW